MFKNVILGWVGRRALEVGGLLGTIWSIYSAMPPNYQETIRRSLTGEWQDITLGALVPFAIYIGSQVLSFRATVQPQVVTPDGTKVRTRDLDPSTRTKVEVDIAGKKIEAKKAAPIGKPALGGLLDWFVKR